jgi:hypothetical protein
MSTNPISGSSLLNRMWLAAAAGLGFKGARDYYEVLGYKRLLTPQDLMAKYERQDITKRVVDKPCEAIWAYPPEVKEGSAKAKKAIKTLKKLGLFTALLQADRLLCFDQFSILWLGLPGNPETPASASSVEDIKYMSAHGAGSVDITKYEQNTNSERFGMPVEYRIRIDRQGIPNSASIPVTVHWSRVVHLVDSPLQGRIMSNPRLAPMANLLDDIFKIAGSSAETYWLAANRGMQVDIDKEMQLSAPDAQALSDELDEYQHQLRRFLRTRGVKVTNLGSDAVDPSNVFTTLIGLLAAASGIPQRILLGAEAGQLASEQDRANWAETVNQRRTTFVEPYVLRPLFLHMEFLGILPKDTTIDLEYEWPEAFRQNPLENAQTMSAKARALINLSRQSQYGTPYVGMKEGRAWMGLPPELPSDDFLPMAAAAPKGGTGTQKQGGNKDTGGAGGNDGSGDSGGGAQQTDTTPAHEGTADRQSN